MSLQEVANRGCTEVHNTNRIIGHLDQKMCVGRSKFAIMDCTVVESMS